MPGHIHRSTLGFKPAVWGQIRELECQPVAPELPKSFHSQPETSQDHLLPRGRPRACGDGTSQLPLFSSPWCEGVVSLWLICRAAVVDSQQIIELSGSMLSNPPTSGASLGNLLRKHPSPHTIWKWFLKNLLIVVKKQHVGFCKKQLQQQPLNCKFLEGRDVYFGPLCITTTWYTVGA